MKVRKAVREEGQVRNGKKEIRVEEMQIDLVFS